MNTIYAAVTLVLLVPFFAACVVSLVKSPNLRDKEVRADIEGSWAGWWKHCRVMVEWIIVAAVFFAASQLFYSLFSASRPWPGF